MRWLIEPIDGSDYGSCQWHCYLVCLLVTCTTLCLRCKQVCLRVEVTPDSEPR